VQLIKKERKNTKNKQTNKQRYYQYKEPSVSKAKLDRNKETSKQKNKTKNKMKQKTNKKQQQKIPSVSTFLRFDIIS